MHRSFYFYLLLIISTFVLTACFKSAEPTTISAVFVDPDTGAYARLNEDGSFFYNTKPTRPNQFMEEKDPEWVEGAYKISSSGALEYYPLDNPGVPIQFVFSNNQKKILVAEGFPGDEVHHMMILYDPEQLELFELHNL